MGYLRLNVAPRAAFARWPYEKIDFAIVPHILFGGEMGEQATMFFCDPSGNGLEFKSFPDWKALLASECLFGEVKNILPRGGAPPPKASLPC